MDGDERPPGDPQPIGPSRLLPLRPALVKAFSVPGCRAVYAVTFGVNGNALAAADGNGRAYLRDLVSGDLARTFGPRRGGGLNGVAFGLGGDLLAGYGLTFDPAGTILAAACGNGWVYLWDMATRRLVGAFAGPIAGA